MGVRHSRSTVLADRTKGAAAREAAAAEVRSLPSVPVDPAVSMEGVEILDASPPDADVSRVDDSPHPRAAAGATESNLTDDGDAGNGQVEPRADWQFVQFDGEETCVRDESLPLALSSPMLTASSAEFRPFDAPSSDELTGLREQLDGKDELISALVVELEQVVEQLDRLQRNGSERPRGGGHRSPHAGSALSPEAAEEQQQVMGDLQRVVQQWDELQAASVLGRIESELAELRSLMMRGGQPLAPSDGSVRDRNEPRGGLDGVLARLAIDAPERGRAESLSVGAGTSWERMKRQMLGEADPSVGIDEATESVVTGETDRVVASSSELAGESPVERFTGLGLIDLEAASREELQAACVERDASLVQLTRMLRSRCSVALPDNWDDIAGVPADVKNRADQLAARLEEQVRLAEVELSLDRARLSRERAQLQAERATIERQLKRLGLSSLDELENIAVESGSASDRRWMRFLGVNRRS